MSLLVCPSLSLLLLWPHLGVVVLQGLVDVLHAVVVLPQVKEGGGAVGQTDGVQGHLLRVGTFLCVGVGVAGR